MTNQTTTRPYPIRYDIYTLLYHICIYVMLRVKLVSNNGKQKKSCLHPIRYDIHTLLDHMYVYVKLRGKLVSNK